MSFLSSLRRTLIGRPKDVRDPSILHKLALMPLLAWVGLGADGLSSSAYGPEEAFRALGSHKGLAFFLAVATALTIFIISYGYSRIVEQFPAGGGGYVVASKLLGPRMGVISGSALVVDYVLTIAISIASGADAILSFLPPDFLAYKLLFAMLGIATLSILNLRGVKESVTSISPIFAVFVITHVIVIVVTLIAHMGDLPAVAEEVRSSVGETTRALGVVGALGLFVRAYSLGGGTYTGIEAVSNAVPIMREPRVETARRTMALMAFSLAFMAGGIVVCYLLMNVDPVAGKTMNAVLVEKVASTWRIGELDFGGAFTILTLVSEGGLLLIAAQAGFVDGPRVMANMATDSWLPHRFAALSERLTMRNGVLLMSVAAIAALIYTRGEVSHLVVMYSINVFITFSLSNIAMMWHWLQHRSEEPKWQRHFAVHAVASLLCVTILVITVYEKLREGGWVTVVVTAAVVALCFSIKRHYARVGGAIRHLDTVLPGPEGGPDARDLYADVIAPLTREEPDPQDPVAIMFVGSYSALGRRTITALLRMFPGHFRGLIFVSIAIVDSDTFKGVREIRQLEEKTKESLDRYTEFSRTLGLPALALTATGAEIAVEAEKVATELVAKFPRAMVVAGQIIFEEDTAWNRIMHNETAFLIQRRLQRAGIPMIVLPIQLLIEDSSSFLRFMETLRARWRALFMRSTARG